MKNKWLVDQMTKRTPKVFDAHDYIWIFCVATLPAYFTLLAFGFQTDSLDIPLIVAGVVAVVGHWAVNALDWKIWQRNRKNWEDRLSQED